MPGFRSGVARRRGSSACCWRRTPRLDRPEAHQLGALKLDPRASPASSRAASWRALRLDSRFLCSRLELQSFAKQQSRVLFEGLLRNPLSPDFQSIHSALTRDRQLAPVPIRIVVESRLQTVSKTTAHWRGLARMGEENERPLRMDRGVVRAPAIPR
jgi:hypothetical protein